MGTFTKNPGERTGAHLVIHNPGMWVLAKIGIVGLLILLPLLLAVVTYLLIQLGQGPQWDDHALLFCLVAAATSSTVPPTPRCPG